MKNILRNSILAVTMLGAGTAAIADLSITSYTIDGGGGTSSGGTFTLSGTIGQPDAGTLSNGSLVLQGGFWPTAVPPACIGDLNSDGIINTFDLAILLGKFGVTTPPPTVADINNDGIVNTFDLALLLAHFGQNCP